VDLAAERLRFNNEVAPRLAGLVSRGATVDNVKASTRFCYFSTADELIIVAGAQEEKECDLALAYGMKLRKDRGLVLVLPAEYSFPTEQRLPFLEPKARPTLRSHQVPPGGNATSDKQPTVPVSTSRAEKALREKLGAVTPADELYSASTAAHLEVVSIVVGG
jgi:hypothetical protein